MATYMHAEEQVTGVEPSQATSVSRELVLPTGWDREGEDDDGADEPAPDGAYVEEPSVRDYDDDGRVIEDAGPEPPPVGAAAAPALPVNIRDAAMKCVAQCRAALGEALTPHADAATLG